MNFKTINKVWQLLGGGFIAPVLFTMLIILAFTDSSINKFQWLMWLHLPIIMVHEFEEYVLPGGFKEFLNTKTFLAPKILKEDIPLNEPYIFFVNIVIAWLWIIIGAFVAINHPWVGFGTIIFQVLINNIQHIFLFQFPNKGYNPGLATTILLIMPYCTFVTWFVLHNGVLTINDWILSVALGMGVVIMLLFITTTRNKLSTHAKLDAKLRRI